MDKLRQIFFCSLSFTSCHSKVVKYEKRYKLIVGASAACDMSYIIQTVIAYQYSVPTKVSVRYAGLYNHDRNHMAFLKVEKRLTNSKYFY